MSPRAVIRMDDAGAGAQPAATVGFPALFVVLVELAKSMTSAIQADTVGIAKKAPFTTNGMLTSSEATHNRPSVGWIRCNFLSN